MALPTPDDRAGELAVDGVPGGPSSHIGVAAIPASFDQAPVPAPVPSAPVPDGDLPHSRSPIQLAPLPPGPKAPSEPVAKSLAKSPAKPVARPAAEPKSAGSKSAGTTAAPPTSTLDSVDAGFAPGVSAKLQTYVYLLVDPRTGRPFFVGQGRGDRCFRHVRAARLGSVGGPGAAVGIPSKYPMLDRIREIEAGGRPVRIELLRYGLTVDVAGLVEASVSDALGLQAMCTLGTQRRSAVEVSSLLAKRAKFKRAHQVVLLRVGGIGSDPEYGVARHGWRIGRRWTDLESVRSPRWAVLVAGDMVAGVCRIDAWEPTPDIGAGRYSFIGLPDAELEKRYVGKSVAAYFASTSPSSITYVWCGPHWVNTPH